MAKKKNVYGCKTFVSTRAKVDNKADEKDKVKKAVKGDKKDQ